MKNILLILLASTFLSANSHKELRDCYLAGDNECGFKLAKELKKTPQTEEESLNIFLELTLSGHTEAPTYLGKGFIYNKGVKQDCKKGISFLMIGSKTDPEAIKEMALLFKRGKCVKKDDIKYKKYFKIYKEEKKKLKKL